MSHTGSFVPDLPVPNTKRWVARRKAMVVNGVLNGAISLEEACRRYQLSVEEFRTWQRAIEAHGVPGLRATRFQIYRDIPIAGLVKQPPIEASSDRLTSSNLSAEEGASAE